MSKFNKAVNDYLLIRRAVGFRLVREGMWLPHFAAFLEERGSEFVTIKLALEWATSSPRASKYSHARRLGMVRNFAKYLHGHDRRTEIPGPDLLPFRQHRYSPYVYSALEIEALINACGCLDPLLKRDTYATLIGLLAVTGMRLGEAIGLDRDDVDGRRGVITIWRGKFGKSREVPVHQTTVDALCAYAKKRDRVHRRPKSPSFFLSQNGKRLFPQNVWRTFDDLRRTATLGDRWPKPRIHDLRHTFAVRTLLGWYGEGVDVERRLALLSTYLGHVSPSSTYWYLTGTPELMAFAARRLEKSMGDLQ